MNKYRKQAIEYLEQLQEQTYQSYGLQPPATGDETNTLTMDDDFIRGWLQSRNAPNDAAAIKAFRESWEETRQKSIAARTTRYENVGWLSLLNDITEEFEAIFKVLKLKAPEHYLFGTLPINQVNGMAMAIPENPCKLIIIETGLFGFANLMCKVVASSFVFEKDERGMSSFSMDINQCRQQIEDNPLIPERFFDVLTAYVVLGKPHFAKQYFLEQRYDGLSTLLRQGFEYFVIAHEFGHLIAGHLDTKEKKDYNIAGNTTEEIVTNWNQEFEADLIGTNILINVMRRRGFDMSLSYWGIEVFFGCLDVVEKTLSVLRTGATGEQSLSETHPPTLMRRQRIREAMTKSFDKQTVDSVLAITSVVEQVIGHLWDKTEPHIIRLYNQNVQPSVHWG